MAFAEKSTRTQKIFLADAKAFAAFQVHPPGELGQAEVRLYVKHLIDRNLSASRLRQHLAAIPSPVYRMLFRTMFAAGLRTSGVCRMRMGDLDTDLGVIQVLGKGRFERMVALHPRLRDALRGYWREVRPLPPWVFTGQRGRPVDCDQARKVFKAAVRQSGLTKRADLRWTRKTSSSLQSPSTLENRKPPMAAPIRGATQNSHSCRSAHPPSA